MVNPSNLDSTWIKCLHKIPSHFLGSSGWWEMGKTRLSFPGAPSPARAARTAEGRDSAKKPVLACFDLNNFFFSSATASKCISFGRKSEAERMFIQTIIYPSDKDISNTTQSGNAGKRWPQFVSRVVKEKMWLKGRGFCKTPFRPNPAVKYTGSWAPTGIQAATKSEFRCTFMYSTGFQRDDGLQCSSWISVCQGMEIKRQEFSKNFWLFQKPACCKYCALQAVGISYGKSYKWKKIRD